MDSFTMLLGLLTGIIFAGMILVLVCYILECIGDIYILRISGHKHPLDGWIPVFNTFLVSRTTADEEGCTPFFGRKVSNFGLSLFPVYSLLFSFVPTVGSLLSFLCSFLLGGAVYTALFAKMEGKDIRATRVMGHLAAAFGIVRVVKLLQYRLGKVPGAF